MGDSLLPSYRLVAKRDGEVKSQGTGWFVTRTKVITAWHVIESVRELPRVAFELELGDEVLCLEYVPKSEDAKNDLAVLHVRKADRSRIPDGIVLPLADRQPERNARWYARGFPARREGKEQTADGEVTNPAGSRQRLELYVRQGTDETWQGISGAPLVIGSQVAGVVSAESAQRDQTAYAVPHTAIVHVVPELWGRRERLRYSHWLRSQFPPPDWCRAHAPGVVANSGQIESFEELCSLLIGRASDANVWLIAEDEPDTRLALLRRITDALIASEIAADEGCYGLPIWCALPSSPHAGSDLLQMTREMLGRTPSAISAAESETLLLELNEVMRRKRAIFVLDGADAEAITILRQRVGDKGSLLVGVSRRVVEEFPEALRFRIAALTAAGRRCLATHWLSAEEYARHASVGAFLPGASRPLDVSVWCRAQRISDRFVARGLEQVDGGQGACVDALDRLIDCLLTGKADGDHPRSSGTDKPLDLDFLARLAYRSLIDGVQTITSRYLAHNDGERGLRLSVEAALEVERIAEGCGLMRKDQNDGYCFAHGILQERLAAEAMLGDAEDCPLTEIAQDAAQIRDAERIASWSRALAMRLDRRCEDADTLLGVLLNHGLPEGYGTRLRNSSGPLSHAVCQAILHTDRLTGTDLRKAIGWVEPPHDWTGYQPDDWRSLEELLRYLDGLALRVPDDRSLSCLLSRMLGDARTIEIALLRFSLAKELRRRKREGQAHAELAALYDRERFFALAGRGCHDCDKVKIDFRKVPAGWFFMGAPPAEERSWPNERPRHRVRLPTYYIARTELTNEQYEVFDPEHAALRAPCEAEAQPQNSRASHGSAHLPVARVSWYEAWCFAEWMGCKLPSEAQWEKAARGKNATERPQTISQEPQPYWFPGEEDDLMNVACYQRSAGRSGPAEVDINQGDYTRLLHPWGLGGFCGNVWEWCMDVQGFQYTEGDRNPPQPNDEDPRQDVITNRAIRGGSYKSPAWNCRHATRHYAFPTVRADSIGFRLCKELAEE